MERISEYKKAQKWLEGFEWDDNEETSAALATICEALQEVEKCRTSKEQGLLLVLPCPIGTTVYDINWWDEVQEKVKIDGKTYYRTVHKHKVSESTFSYMDIPSFGETVFLTEEEARKVLFSKEAEGDKPSISNSNIRRILSIIKKNFKRLITVLKSIGRR